MERERAQKIKLIILDVDGVQTDGGLYMGLEGETLRRFDIRDGTGISIAIEAGLRVAFMSGKSSPAIRRRAAELGVEDVFEDLRDKNEAYEALKTRYGLLDEEVAYVADDIIDLPVLQRVGLAIAVGDAVEEVQRVAHRVTVRPGGRGAVREVVEYILRAQGKWEEILKTRYGLL
jgi:3-deoxy-D-manno-octulosonate 8-phosphate phosphatase (KDO 8-P phosphatase)